MPPMYEEVGDEVDDLIDEVSGEYEEVGLSRKRSAKPRNARIVRKKRDTPRVGYLGFGAAVSTAAAAQTTFTDQVQRPYQPNKLIMVVGATGIVVDSIKIGDIEHIVGSKSVVAEVFDKNALLAPDDDFEPAGSGVTVTVKATNTTAGAVNIAASFRGECLI